MADENGSSQQVIRKIHPLLNDDILRHLFRFDNSPEAVQRNRLVCVSWKEANEYNWKRLRKCLILQYDSSTDSSATTNPLRLTFSEFCNEYHASITKLYNTPQTLTQMHLIEWRNFAGEPWRTDLDLWFWSVTATEWLTKLKLTDCNFKEDIPIYKQTFIEAMPNLENLSLVNCVAYPNAVEKVNKLHECLYSLRNPSLTEWLLGRNRSQFSPYHHTCLTTLDIDIKVAETTQPLKIWSLVFAVFPQLEKLRLGGEISGKKSGHFLELRNALECGRPTRNLTHLDLLDFSGKAQEYCLVDDGGWIFYKLESVAYDLGIFEVSKNSYFRPSTRVLKHVTLYRAPFSQVFPNLQWRRKVDSVELWGNVDSDLKFEHLGSFGLLRKLIWNTRCYDSTYHGKRIQHLLDANRKAYPLFTKDLVMETGDVRLQGFRNLTHLDIDFGPLSTESWKRLGRFIRNLITLKAVFGEDKHLEVVMTHWPNLVSLELKHRSVVSIRALEKLLLRNTLAEFRWKSCACTQPLFTNAPQTRQLENLGRHLQNIELPWKWNPSGNELLVEKVCLERQFEGALLKAADNGETTSTEMKRSWEEIWIRMKENSVTNLFMNIFVFFIIIGLFTSPYYIKYLI